MRKIISFMHTSLDGFVAGCRASEKVITFAKQHVVRHCKKRTICENLQFFCSVDFN